MTAYVGVDPGVRGCGVAAVSLAGEVLAAAYVRRRPSYDLAAYAEEVALSACASAGPIVLVELPQVYPRGKGDPNDLIALSVVVGAVIASVGKMSPLAEVSTVLPREWTKGVPKEIRHARMALSPAEDSRVVWPAVSLRHNVRDAIGIARFAASSAARRSP